MKLKITIDIDNNAFLYDNELEKTLSRVGAAAVEQEYGTHPKTKIIDSNGNTVGYWEIVNQ